MNERTIDCGGVIVPRFLYGTAWKEQQTEPLVQEAIAAGFRGIDTANQRRHYHEQAVGDAVASLSQSGAVTRDELFLQTKFTFRPGQDHRLPYDPAASISQQVQQSFASSLQHLQTDRIDSYLLHGPMHSAALGAEDWEAWRAIESLHQRGAARLIGVSNFSAEQLQELLGNARVRPTFVQNRCYAVRHWDKDVRVICQANEMLYQGFSLLTANRAALTHPDLVKIAARHERTAAQVVFRFALDVGMIPLTGTTDEQHMRQDLDVFDFQLDPNEVRRIETL